MARLLVCRSCGTMNRMRDYDGDAHYDAELQEVIRMHLERASDPRPEAHPSSLFRVDDADAEILDVESKLVEHMSKEQVFIKDTRDDLRTEALKCFNRHNRPQDGCIDWKDESKIVGRKIGVPKQHRKYLCEFCPVASYVMTEVRHKAGMYSKD